MNDSVGIGIASSRGSMEDLDWSWDSRRKKMAVDLKELPPHLDLIEIDGGTPWVLNNGERREETVFEIEHKMPFPPKVLTYFYLYDAPYDRASLIGAHSEGIAPMVFNAFGFGSEWLSAEVDEKYFKIRHKAVSQAAGAQFFGRAFKYRLRYEITNLKHISSRASSFYL